MTYDVIVEQRDGQQAAVIKEPLPCEDVSRFPYTEIFAALAGQGRASVAGPFARIRVEGAVFHVTAGVPAGIPKKPRGRVQTGGLPAAQMASSVHVSSYEDLPEASHAIMDWISGNGHAIAADPWESHLDGPKVSSPRIKVGFPVVRVDGDGK